MYTVCVKLHEEGNNTGRTYIILYFDGINFENQKIVRSNRCVSLNEVNEMYFFQKQLLTLIKVLSKSAM